LPAAGRELLRADAAPGQLIGGSADLESAIVGSINERP
jgi:hypothetical protein